MPVKTAIAEDIVRLPRTKNRKSYAIRAPDAEAGLDNFEQQPRQVLDRTALTAFAMFGVGRNERVC